MRLILALALVLVLAPQAQADVALRARHRRAAARTCSTTRASPRSARHVRLVTAYDVVCRPGVDQSYLDNWLEAAARRRPARWLRSRSARGTASVGSCPATAPTCAASGIPRALSVGARLQPLERGQPLLSADLPPPDEGGRLLQRHAPRLPELQRRRRRRARLEQPGRWLHRYRAAPPRPPAAVVDAQLPRRQPPAPWRRSGTLQDAAHDPRRLWITETAGVVVSRRYPNYDEQRAAGATRRMLAFASRSPRITRVYAYQWQAGCDPLRLGLGLVSLERLGPAGLARGRGRSWRTSAS